MLKPELNVYLVLLNNSEILLLKRHNDIWEFPGGGVEYGEHPEVSTKRECVEECGIKVDSVELIGVTSATYKKEGKEKQSIYIVYKSNVTGKEFKISGEHADAKWVAFSELKNMSLGLNARPIVEMLNFK
ncbi:MAG: NUDIX hydrolase [Candidatus Micrarchaeota archaeon]|nr:NUDIX hydrolase [Candidatus Micrarchaeota archaeon]